MPDQKKSWLNRPRVINKEVDNNGNRSLRSRNDHKPPGFWVGNRIGSGGSPEKRGDPCNTKWVSDCRDSKCGTSRHNRDSQRGSCGCGGHRCAGHNLQNSSYRVGSPDCVWMCRTCCRGNQKPILCC